MQYTENMKHSSLIIFPAMIILQLLLVGFQWLPTRESDMTALNIVRLQQVRSQTLAKNAQIIGYITDSFTRSQAIGDMEITLPPFESDQAAMSNFHDTDLQNIVAQSRSDYLAIDIATKLVLAQSHGIVDKNQITIILARSRSYSGTMSQVALSVQQVSKDAQWRLYMIELSIDGMLIALITTTALIFRGNAKAIQRELLQSLGESKRTG